MDDSSGTEYYCFSQLAVCFFLSLIFVASLYVWNLSHERDHPKTIKRRILSVSIVSLCCPLLIKSFLRDDVLEQNSLWELLGLKTEGIIAALTLPLLLTMVLFLGPTVMHVYSTPPQLNLKLSELRTDFCNLQWLRDQVVAPLSEEFTFRACMLPLLLQCLRPSIAIILCPLFFGIAHFHHASEMIRKGVPITRALSITTFQFCYTTLFGTYAAFLFVRTDFAELFSLKQPARYFIIALLVLGLVVWIILLFPMTQPVLYNNKCFWIEAASSTTTNISMTL